MEPHITAFLTALGSVSAPALVTIGGIIFIWAIATERLVLGKQYRAERERGDKYEEAHRTATQALIENVAGQEATITIVTAFREELARFSGKGSSQ